MDEVPLSSSGALTMEAMTALRTAHSELGTGLRESQALG